MPEDPEDLLAYGEELTLIGYSMGGRVALMFAACYPERIKKLIILSAHPGLEKDVERKKRALWENEWLAVMERESQENFLEKWYSQPLFASLRLSPRFPSILERRKKACLSKAKILFDRYRLSTQPNLWPHLPHLPVTFIYGKDDQKYQSIYSRLNSLGVACHLVEGGHAFHLENPSTGESFL